jgi:hypothetical protein
LDFHFVVIVVIEAGVVYQFVINWWQNPATAPSLSVSLEFHDAILSFTLKLGSGDWDRTCDQLINSQLLYR